MFLDAVALRALLLIKCNSLRYGTIPLCDKTGRSCGFCAAISIPAKAPVRGCVFNDTMLPPCAGKSEPRSMYDVPKSWQQLMQNAMAQDFSWTRQDRRYGALYRELLGNYHEDKGVPQIGDPGEQRVAAGIRWAAP